MLPTSFYLDCDTPTIARRLLGKILVCETDAGITSGIIVETEAYLSSGDPASHSARGKTKRNACMFGPPGTSYIYISYGVHYCMNVVCQPAGIGEAVLIRALEPVEGIELMRSRRGHRPEKELTNGPGKLCQAMGIDLALNGHDLALPPLYLLDGPPPAQIGCSGRIGISVGRDLPLRFYVVGNKFVSRSPRH